MKLDKEQKLVLNRFVRKSKPKKRAKSTVLREIKILKVFGTGQT